MGARTTGLSPGADGSTDSFCVARLTMTSLGVLPVRVTSLLGSNPNFALILLRNWPIFRFLFIYLSIYYSGVLG